MANIVKMLNGEIRRLARRELRGEVSGLRKSGAALRREIAGLKKQLVALHRSLKGVARRQGRMAAAPAGGAEGPVNLRFSAKGLRKHRDRLGLSARDFAKLIGVSALSIYNWELGKSRPGASKLNRIAEVRALGKREALKQLEENPLMPKPRRRKNGAKGGGEAEAKVKGKPGRKPGSKPGRKPGRRSALAKAPTVAATGPEVKRRRGRPRKNPAPEAAVAPVAPVTPVEGPVNG
jgi:transcriptional regulator with XRE-family HTH domain